MKFTYIVHVSHASFGQHNLSVTAAGRTTAGISAQQVAAKEHGGAEVDWAVGSITLVSLFERRRQ